MKNKDVRFIEIRGNARERGRQYGEATRDLILQAIEFYQESFALASKLSWSEIQERARLWVPVIEAYLPGITEEMRGLAEGSNRTFEEILALNGRGELSYGNPFADAEAKGCSSFAITAEASGDGHVYCGQNWDWASRVAPTVIMLRIVQPPKPTIIMQAEAGQVGRQGVNSRGVALNANGLGGRFGKGIGIPGPYIRRKVLDAPDMNDALDAIFTAKQNGCTNILVTHQEGVVIDVETTPGRHGWLYPTDGILVHTNHFIAHVPPQIEETYRPFSVDSLYRLTQIEKVLRRAKKAKTQKQMRDLIASALRDHFGFPNSVCNHEDTRRPVVDRTQTIASSIVDLTAGDYYVALGLPCETQYRKVPWSIYDE